MGKPKEPIQENPITRSSGDNVPPPGPGREPSDEEESGVEATDTEAKTPLGVGESTTRRGEDVIKEEGKEPGRSDTGAKGKAQRPTGTSDPRDTTAVHVHDTLDQEPPD